MNNTKKLLNMTNESISRIENALNETNSYFGDEYCDDCDVLITTRKKLAEKETELKEMKAQLEEAQKAQKHHENERHHWGHDFVELRAGHNNFLQEKIKPLLSDVLDAIDMKAYDIAHRRVKTILGDIAKAHEKHLEATRPAKSTNESISNIDAINENKSEYWLVRDTTTSTSKIMIVVKTGTLEEMEGWKKGRQSYGRHRENSGFSSDDYYIISRKDALNRIQNQGWRTIG